MIVKQLFTIVPVFTDNCHGQAHTLGATAFGCQTGPMYVVCRAGRVQFFCTRTCGGGRTLQCQSKAEILALLTPAAERRKKEGGKRGGESALAWMERQK